MILQLPGVQRLFLAYERVVQANGWVQVHAADSLRLHLPERTEDTLDILHPTFWVMELLPSGQATPCSAQAFGSVTRQT
ncbi:hypothetical protein ABO04_11775 [Nitrosomonas sp. HPC101]|nr:hypothetical protein [Nitrosomonas sp. HPC101]